MTKKKYDLSNQNTYKNIGNYVQKTTTIYYFIGIYLFNQFTNCFK